MTHRQASGIADLDVLAEADVATADKVRLYDVSAGEEKAVTVETLQGAIGADGILFLASTGIEANPGNAQWLIQNDARADDLPSDVSGGASVGLTVRILGKVFGGTSASGDMMPRFSGRYTIAADKWGVVRVLAVYQTNNHECDYTTIVPVEGGEQSYDTSAEAEAAAPAVPWGSVSLGLFLIQATGDGYDFSTPNIDIGDGVADLIIRQPTVIGPA